jgi:hypothetical protein
MKTIKQTLPTPISIVRKDTGETVTLEQDVPVTVDDETAAYLLSMVAFDEYTGEHQIKIVEV